MGFKAGPPDRLGAAVELTTPEVIRAIRYLRMLNDQGIRPTERQVEVFAAAGAPRPARYVSYFDTFQSYMESMLTFREPGESVTAFLQRMEWAATDSDGLTLTTLGRAFLLGLARELAAMEADEATPTVVVLEPGSPLSSVELTQALAEAGAGMLVDPYFRPEQVQWIVTTTKVARVLMRDPRAGAGPHAVALGHTVGAERLEIRATGDRELHDRCVLSEDGSVTLIGTSINGVGRHLTTLVPLAAGDAKSYRDRLEGLYEAASVIQPVRVDGEPQGPPAG